MKAPVPKLSSEKFRSRFGKICVAIVASTADEMIQKAEAALHDVSFLELRLDFLDEPFAALPAIEALLFRRPDLVVIATCRRAENGGRFSGSIADELAVLDGAAQAGCHLLDLEIESAEALAPAELDRLRALDCSLILSFHDFAATRDLDATLARLTLLRPDLAKIVPTAQSLTDNLSLFGSIEHVDCKLPVVAMCMGEQGLVSRVLGPRSGSAFTFASTARGEESAPGQITARTLLELYRLPEIDAETRIYGVAGTHVRSSLSPVMHNAAFAREAINAVYLPLQTTEIADLLRLTAELPISGLSVTMPFKQQILPFLDQVDPVAARVGAVNTVHRLADGKLHGSNTDVVGITGPLERRLSLERSRILLLGAGGAARAAAFGLRDKGAEVAILNRSPEAAQALATQTGSTVIRRDHLGSEHFDVIVNATPIGMKAFASESPLTAEELRADLIFDLVYNPIETPLLALARQQNIAVITGVEMFVEQGAKQFETWTGTPSPREEMTRVVLNALRTTDSLPAEKRAEPGPEMQAMRRERKT